MGRAIVSRILAVAAERNYERVSLETGPTDAFAPARSWYAKVGFGCGINAPSFAATVLRIWPHHTRRISESGPDHPGWVIALCPTCHRRVHHSVDGAAYNQELETRLLELEPE